MQAHAAGNTPMPGASAKKKAFAAHKGATFDVRRGSQSRKSSRKSAGMGTGSAGLPGRMRRSSGGDKDLGRKDRGSKTKRDRGSKKVTQKRQPQLFRAQTMDAPRRSGGVENQNAEVIGDEEQQQQQGLDVYDSFSMDAYNDT